MQWNCKFGIEYEVSDIFLYYFFSCGKHQKITKLPSRENFEPTKYPREKIQDPRTTHEGTMARWHKTRETHDGTRPTKFSTLLGNGFSSCAPRGSGNPNLKNRVKKSSYRLWRYKTELSQIVTLKLIFRNSEFFFRVT